MTVRAMELQVLGRQLRRLADQPVLAKSDLDGWYELAHQVRQRILADENLARAVPHFVWHFLSDADIRFREPEYARQQLAQLMEIVVVLERGQVPELG